MQLKEIRYLTNAHMLGSSPVPTGFRTVVPHPVMDHDTGNCGVLLQNENTGLYALYVGGKEHLLSSVSQRAAADYVKTAWPAAAKQPARTDHDEHEMQR